MLRCEFEAIRLGISQSEIAKQCCVSPQQVNAVFRERNTPYPKLRQGIAAALGWTKDTALLFEHVTLTENTAEGGEHA